MNYNNLEKNILKVWLVLVIFVSIVLSIVSIISYTYLTGFLFGSLVSLVIFLANNFFIGILLKSKKTFKKTFFISIIKTLLTSGALIGILILVIFINKAFNKNSDLPIDGIFNFFTVFFGLLTHQISIIFYHILVFMIKKTKNQEREN